MPRPKPIWHDAAKVAGIERSVFAKRLKAGLTIEQALSVKRKNTRIPAIKYILANTYTSDISRQWLQRPITNRECL